VACRKRSAEIGKRALLVRPERAKGGHHATLRALYV